MEAGRALGALLGGQLGSGAVLPPHHHLRRLLPQTDLRQQMAAVDTVERQLQGEARGCHAAPARWAHALCIWWLRGQLLLVLAEGRAGDRGAHHVSAPLTAASRVFVRSFRGESPTWC